MRYTGVSAELLALSHASTRRLWWNRFFTSINLHLDQYQVECDNQQTIRQVTTPAARLATKLKHIDVHNHWLRQEVANRKLDIKRIPTAEMPADGLT